MAVTSPPSPYGGTTPSSGSPASSSGRFDDDDFDDDPFAFPPRRGGFGAGASQGGFPSRRGFGEQAPPPKTKADLLREDIENAKHKVDELRTAVTAKQSELEEARKKQADMKEVDKRVRALLSQQFPGRFQSGSEVDFGCFAEEQKVMVGGLATMEEGIDTLSREITDAEKVLAEKEAALEKYLQEEEEKKREAANAKTSEEASATGDAPQENFFVGVKRYWESIESEDKTAILNARNTIATRLGEEKDTHTIQKWFLETLGSSLEEKQKKDIELAKNVQETALLISIAAHRAGKLDELLAL